MTRSIQLTILILLVMLSGCFGAVMSPDEPTQLRFEDKTESSELVYDARASRTVRMNTADAGVYVADINNDGWPDLLTIGGAPTRYEGSAPEPALFVNDNGSFKRSDGFPIKSLRGKMYGGALFFDEESDGDQDLLLLPVKSQPIFLENEGGTFSIREIGFDVKFEVPVGATTADYDRDGDLDVFVFQNGNWGNMTPVRYAGAEAPLGVDNGKRNVLFENTEDGFKRIEDAGIKGKHWTLAASFVDLNGDGWPDIHVANDYYYDHLYLNQGDGTFHRARLGDSTNRNGMSSEVADVNGDGRPDIFVTNIFVNRTQFSDQVNDRWWGDILGNRTEGNNLLINTGNGSFTDKAKAYGVQRGGWGWAAVVADLDNDGDQDIIHTTKRFSKRLLEKSFERDWPTFYTYPAVWERTSEGFVQRNASRLGFERTGGRGLARLDYDRDGDLDLILAPRKEGLYRVYENTGATGNWLQIRVRNDRPQPIIGTRVYVTVNGTTRLRVVNARADYQSQDTRLVHVGLGKYREVDRVRIVWPDGESRTITDIEANARLIITRGGDIKRTG